MAGCMHLVRAGARRFSVPSLQSISSKIKVTASSGHDLKSIGDATCRSRVVEKTEFLIRVKRVGIVPNSICKYTATVPHVKGAYEEVVLEMGQNFLDDRRRRGLCVFHRRDALWRAFSLSALRLMEFLWPSSIFLLATDGGEKTLGSYFIILVAICVNGLTYFGRHCSEGWTSRVAAIYSGD